MGSDAYEIELKLHAAPDDLARLRRLPLLSSLRVGAPKTQRFVTTYFDTPDLGLARSGVALRVRRAGRRRIQTVKARARAALGDSAGAAVRREWEWHLPSNDPDLAVLDGLGICALPDAEDLARIRPIFRTEIERTTMELVTHSAARIELAFDRGAIIVGTARVPVSEIELELLQEPDAHAQIDQLYEIALLLHEAVPLQIGTDSKADIGYAVLSGAIPKPCKSVPVALTARETGAEAFARIARACISHLLDNQRCVLEGSDSGAIHQMRVALRRLRAAMSLFKGLIGTGGAAALRREVKWLAGELSPARDWDVLVEETLARFKRMKTIAAAARSLAPRAKAARNAARQRAVAAVCSPRYAALVLRLGQWIEEQRWPKGEALPVGAREPISAAAPLLLDRRARKVRDAGKRIASLSAEQRHELRKSLKTMRYAASFFSSLYPGRRTERYLAALSGMQDVLGLLNDLSVADELVGSLDRDPDSAAVKVLRKALAARLEVHLADLPAASRTFKTAEPFWRRP
jgi:triphosphatase